MLRAPASISMKEPVFAAGPPLDRPFYCVEGLVALLVLAYIACIGPLDYFVVRRLFGRMEFTWLTFALMVAASSPSMRCM